MTADTYAAPVPGKDKGRSDRVGTGSSTIVPTCLSCRRSARLAAEHLRNRGLWGDWQRAAFQTSCSSSCSSRTVS